jgi:proton-dependent oligopeptide transporter, POT family
MAAGRVADSDFPAIAEAEHHIFEEKKNHPRSNVKVNSVSLDEDHVIMNDGIHDGLVFPTEEEMATLRRVSDAIPWSAYRTSLTCTSSLCSRRRL